MLLEISQQHNLSLVNWGGGSELKLSESAQSILYRFLAGS